MIEKYIIVDTLGKEYPVTKLCLLFNVNRFSYYKWVKRGKPKVHRVNQSDLEIITVEHNKTNHIYGVLRLKYQIQNVYGLVLNHKKIRRYKQIFNLKTKARVRKPWRNILKKANYSRAARNLLECNFKSDSPSKKLSTDVSYIPCKDGLLYLSAVKDLFNNQIVAYNISEKNDLALVMDTIKQLPKSNGVIHSDQGALYGTSRYINLLNELGYERSMSRKGACWENSPIENWFSQLKEECIRRFKKMNKLETIEQIKKYVQWFNHERIQKNLGYLTPVEYLNIN